MLRVGLTGGIASGKSAVSSILRDLDIPVLQADVLGHELLEPEQAAYNDVVKEFGTDILTPAGAVDRAKLATIVFADPAKRAKLNWILHPRILEVVRKWFEALERPGGPDLAFLEAALIFEAGVKKDLDTVVLCWAQHDQQIERLKERGIMREQAERRIAAQMSTDEKRKLADEIIDCSGSMKDTEAQVRVVVDRLRQAAAEKKAKKT
jgi:dephospho-CoA kinase